MINTHIKKEERSQINNLNLHLKELAKENKPNSQVNRKKGKKHKLMEHDREPEINNMYTIDWSLASMQRVYNGGKMVSSTNGVGKTGNAHA